MEYKISELLTDRVHIAHIQVNDLLVEIDNIIYNATVSYDTVIQEPIGFIHEKYLADYFKSIITESHIYYLHGRYLITWTTKDNKFSLELELHNPKELQLLKQIKELETQLKGI